MIATALNLPGYSKKHFTQSVNDSLVDSLMRAAVGFSIKPVYKVTAKKFMITIVMYSVTCAVYINLVCFQQMVAFDMRLDKVSFSEVIRELFLRLPLQTCVIQCRFLNFVRGHLVVSDISSWVMSWQNNQWSKVDF